MNVYYKCPHCGNEIDVEVTRSDNNLPEYCPHCFEDLPPNASEKLAELVREKQDQPFEDDFL